MKLSKYIDYISHRKFKPNAKMYRLIAMRGAIGEVFMLWKFGLDDGGLWSHYRNQLVDKLGNIFSEFCLERGPTDANNEIADLENYMYPEVLMMIELQKQSCNRVTGSDDSSPQISFALLTLFEAVRSLNSEARTFLIAYLTVLSLLKISLEEVVAANIKKV